MARIITPQEVEEIISNAAAGIQQPMEQRVSEPGASGQEDALPDEGETAAELLGVEPEGTQQQDDDTE